MYFKAITRSVTPAPLVAVLSRRTPGLPSPPAAALLVKAA